MRRWLFLGYGIAAYAMFLLVYAYFAAFVGGFAISKTIDGPVGMPAREALFVNLLLVSAFAWQHSVMARPAFKRIWTRVVPDPIERSTYVVLSNLVVMLLIWQWQPIPAITWEVQQPLARTALWVLFAAGWLAVPVVSLFINHFDLFGLRQVWLYFQGQPYTSLPFRAPLAYAHVRHPLYLGWALAFWATPTMTAGHLLLSVSMTAYMMLAAVVEERDLVAHFGRSYHTYRQQVPMFVPRIRPLKPIASEPAEFVVNLSPDRPPEDASRQIEGLHVR